MIDMGILIKLENILKMYFNVVFKSIRKLKKKLWKGGYGVLRGFSLGGSAPQTPRQGGSAPLDPPMKGLGTGVVEFRRLWLVFGEFC